MPTLIEVATGSFQVIGQIHKSVQSLADNLRRQDQEQREIREQAQRRRRVVEQLQRMGWEEFEKLVQQVFQDRGCKVIHTKRNGGVDLWVKGELRGRYKTEKMMRQAIVQCKRYTGHPVERPVVQQLYGVMLDQDQDLGFIVTSDVFSRGAVEFSKFKEIKLIDGGGLADLINDPALEL